MHSKGFDVPAKKDHQTVSDSVSVAYITSIQESTPQGYMLKKCVALPLVIKRPCVEKCWSTIPPPPLPFEVIRRFVLQSAGTHV